jgi:DNA mismatch repair ATPase MutS
MAGKSTFLRTLSINLILAMNGAPVCARGFRFIPCDLLSSIKIQDSLSNNESYFYAELVRIREIIDHVQTNPRTLVVLDEILRGTNTRDKQTGSRGLLEKLISLNAVVLVATHDLALGELEKNYPDVVTNNCFEVELTNDQLIFDYKLKPGISQKLNASYLMKKMGIIEWKVES